MAIALPMTAPEKPAYGQPCNGCGLCCAAEPCAVAVEFLGETEGPCRAMEFEAGRFWCGMVRNPGKHIGLDDFAANAIRESVGKLVAHMLGVGRGCDSGPAVAEAPHP